MRTVFLDTVGLLAVWDDSDQWHEEAAAAFDLLLKAPATLVTTSYVLLECGNAAARRPYRIAVDALRQRLHERQELIEPTMQDWTEGWERYTRGSRGAAGIVDQVSFVVMRRLGVTEAFTNDRHFRDAGFTTLF